MRGLPGSSVYGILHRSGMAHENVPAENYAVLGGDAPGAAPRERKMQPGQGGADMRDTLGVLLAGGAGERLFPLTRDRAKPAVPFGGHYRIIDITLSNCINSGLRRVFIMTLPRSRWSLRPAYRALAAGCASASRYRPAPGYRDLPARRLRARCARCCGRGCRS